MEGVFPLRDFCFDYLKSIIQLVFSEATKTRKIQSQSFNSRLFLGKSLNLLYPTTVTYYVGFSTARSKLPDIY